MNSRLPLPLLFLVAVVVAGVYPTAGSALPPPLPPPLVESFDGNPQNVGLWEAAPLGSGPTVDVVGGALVVTLPANSSGSDFQNGLRSTFALRGDFDIQVGYQLLEWPATNGVRLGLMFRDGTMYHNLHRVSLGPAENSPQGRETYAMGSPGQFTSRVATSDTSGTLRLVREDNTLIGYYASLGSANWAELGRLSFTEEDFRPGILAWSHDGSFADKRVQVAFDNFLVTSGKLVTGSNLVVFTLSTARVKGGKSLHGRATLDAPAPAGGLTVNLRNENPAARCPAKVTIAAGKSTARFTIRTRIPKKTKHGAITAACRGWVYTRELTVTRRKR